MSKELLPLFGILISLIFLANPLDIFMPTTLETIILVFIVLLFFAYLGLIWREKVQDERDEIHRLRAGRTSFVIGIAVLITGIIVQTNAGSIDPWLLITLSSMVISKMVSRLFSDKHH